MPISYEFTEPNAPDATPVVNAALPVRSVDRSCFAHAEAALEREWLVTNGLGGYAAGTVALANTRRYHGLLFAALRPPVDRRLMLAKLEVIVRSGGRTFLLGCNEYEGRVLDPRGYAHLASFDLVGQIPVWTYAIGGVRLEQRLWMPAGHNAVCVEWTLTGATEPCELELVPLCAWRDYHAHQRAGAPFQVEALPGACRVVATAQARPLHLSVAGSEFRPGGDWYWRFHHRRESERGLDSTEDLYRPGAFVTLIEPRQTVQFRATAPGDAEAAARVEGFAHEVARQAALLASLDSTAPPWVRSLTLAADQYLVARRGDAVAASAAVVASAARDCGTTIIAGYPWFADWGRDTMIALPGLALATGRHAEAEAILRTFAAHASEGMLPNRFPDGGEPPEYNTVDATLWFFHAVECYLQASGNRRFLRDIFPVLEDIIAWHVRGTRYGIRVDDDGLLRAGEPGVQLTWMDARVGDWVVTPRIGKPVEVNALWHFALSVMAQWALELGSAGASDYAGRARRAAAAFGPSFWNGEAGCLHDVIDTPDDAPDAHGRRVDRSVRPNQIFAVSLGRDLLPRRQARAVVETCARELLTPVGLRSLSPRDPAYVPRYEGGPRERDGAYHQGTVWSWLLGPFILAHFSVHRDYRYARALLADASRHLDEACVGQVSEIFDAEPPHAPRGCFAQAWSVGESLRAWHVLNPAPGTVAPGAPARRSSRPATPRSSRP